MIFYISHADHFPFGEIGFCISNISDAELGSDAIFRYSVREVYPFSETSGFAEVDIHYNPEKGVPIIMGTFGSGSRNLGVLHNANSKQLAFEDSLLLGAKTRSKETSRFKSYCKGMGLRAFLSDSIRPYFIFYSTSQEDEEILCTLIKRLNETKIGDANKGLSLLHELVSRVDKLIVLRPYERIYLLSSNMKVAKGWLESILDALNIEWVDCSARDFPS